MIKIQNIVNSLIIIIIIDELIIFCERYNILAFNFYTV